MTSDNCELQHYDANNIIEAHADMIDRRNILMCGPVAPPVFGQSLSFTLITQNYLCNEKYIVDQNFKTRSKIEKISVTLKSVAWYLYFFISKKIDLVYFSSSRSMGGCIKDLCLINIASLLKIKLINHVHGTDFENLLNTGPGWFRILVKYSYNKVHTTVVLVEGMRKPFKQFKEMKLKVLPNFYDPVLDEFQQDNKLKDETTFEILYFSNIMKTKGIIEAIDAFLLLSEKIPNIRLNIAGDFISDEEYNATEIKDFFFEKIRNINNIIYHGVLRGEDKSKLFYNSSIFVLPSYYISEAFPVSIIEAMRAGCAVITTKHKYLGEIVKPANGILINIRDVNALVDALEHLITDTQLLKKIRIHNIAEAKNNYSLTSNLDSLRIILNM
jgi:glycosyltransferase involved in cell wall biosynthesis